MTVKSKELTKSMRRVLERMERGAVLFMVNYPDGTALLWGDTGRDSGLSVFYFGVELAQMKLIAWNVNERFYRITPAGRRALKDS